MKYGSQLHRKTHRTRFVAIGVVALALVGIGVFAFWRLNVSKNPTSSQNPETPGTTVSNINYESPTQSDKNASNQQKDAIVSKDQSPSSSSAPADSKAQSIAVTITRASQTAAGQPLSIRTIVNGATSGTCEFTISSAGQANITQTSQISFQATSATCGAVDVPISSFPQGGTWQVSVVAKSSSSGSPAATQNVTITK